MKNTSYLILLITAISFGQPKSEKKIDTSKIKEVALKPTKTDTVKLSNLSTTATVIPIDRNKDTRVVIVKDIAKDDYLKVIIPIFALLLGFFLNVFLGWFTKRKKIKKTGRTFIATLQSVEELMQVQMYQLEFFSADLKKCWLYDSLVVVKDTLNGEFLYSFDRGELMDFIELKNGSYWIVKMYHKYWKKNKEYFSEEDKNLLRISNLVYNYVNRLVNQYEIITKKWEAFGDGVKATTLKYNTDFEQFTKEFGTFALKLKQQDIDITTNPNYKPLFDFYKSWIKDAQQQDFNPLISEENYILPFNALLQQFNNDERIVPMALQLTVLANDIKGMNFERDYFIAVSKDLVLRYKELLAQLPTVIGLLKPNNNS